jgi:exosortase
VVSDPENLAAPERTAPFAWGAGRGVGIPLAIGAAVLAAIGFRGLIGFDPASLPSHDLPGLEGMLFEPSGSAPVILFSGAAWLLFRRMRRITASLGAPSRPIEAAILLSVAFALGTWSYYVNEATLLVPAFSAALLGGALALGGFEAYRAIQLPALFLLFAVPMPAALLNRFMFDLQLATAKSVASFLDFVGIDTVYQADLIFSGGKVFQVIESCSGVRSIETLFMSSFLYHDLFYRSRLQSTLVVFSSIAVGLVVNLLRVMTIVLNPLSRFALVHAAQGLVMIALGVVLISMVDSLLSRFLPARPWWRRTAVVRTLGPGRLAVIGAWSAAFALATVAVEPWKPPVPGVELASVPIQLEGWEGRSLKIDREYLGSVGFSEWMHRSYEREGTAVDVLIGSNRRLDERIDFGSRKVALPGSGWQILNAQTAELASGRLAQRLEIRAPGEERRLAYVFTQDVAGAWTELFRSALALDRGPWRRPGRAFVAVVSTDIDSFEESDARLRTMAALVEAQLARVSAGDRT